MIISHVHSSFRFPLSLNKITTFPRERSGQTKSTREKQLGVCSVCGAKINRWATVCMECSPFGYRHQLIGGEYSQDEMNALRKHAGAPW